MPTLSDEEDSVVDGLAAVLAHGAMDNFLAGPLVRHDAAHFPDAWSGDLRSVRDVLRRWFKYAGLDGIRVALQDARDGAAADEGLGFGIVAVNGSAELLKSETIDGGFVVGQWRLAQVGGLSPRLCSFALAVHLVARGVDGDTLDAVGRRARSAVCSDPACERVIALQDTRCPGCGGVVGGEIKSASERLAAEEELEAQRRIPP